MSNIKRIIKVISGGTSHTEKELNTLIQNGYLIDILFQSATERETKTDNGIHTGTFNTILTTTVSINKKVEIK